MEPGAGDSFDASFLGSLAVVGFLNNAAIRPILESDGFMASNLGT